MFRNTKIDPSPYSRRLVPLLCLLALCFSPIAFAAGVDLSEEELKYDPQVKAQTNKIGRYSLEIAGIKTSLFVQTARLNGALEQLKKASAQFGSKPWVTPNQIPGLKAKALTYAVLVGKGYDPSKPAGVLVGISSGGNGNFLHKYEQVINKHNIIVIGSNQSGNNINPVVRQTLAINAVELIKRRYSVDSNRIYITGGSGGGRAASMTMYYRPDLFKGGMPMIGCVAPIKGVQVDRSSRTALMGLNQMPSKAALKESMTKCRYAFLTGEKDYNRQECEKTAAYMNKNGYKFVTVIVQPKIEHDPHSAEYFEKGLLFLDAPLIDNAVELFDDAKKDLDRERFEDALSGFEQSIAYLKMGKDQETQAKAQAAEKHITALNQQYADAIKAVEDAIIAKDDRAASEALRDVQRAWRNRLDRETANGYRKQILAIKRGG